MKDGNKTMTTKKTETATIDKKNNLPNSTQKTKDGNKTMTKKKPEGDEKTNNNLQNSTYKTIDGTTRTLYRNGVVGDLKCSAMVSRSCSTS